MDILTLAMLAGLLFVFIFVFFVFRKTKKLDESKPLEIIQEDVYTNNLANSLEVAKTEEAKLVAEVIELGEEILNRLDEETTLTLAPKKKTPAKKSSKKKATKKKTVKKVKKPKNEKI